MKKIFFIVLICFLSFNIFSIDYTWTGAVNSNWNNEANWDDGNGYNPGDGYPDDAGDTATIGALNNVTLNENNLTIGDLFLNGTLDCGTNNFTIANLSGTGTFNCGSGAITINGNVTISNFNGDSATIVISGNVNNTNFTASSGTTTIAGDLTISGTFNHNNGTIVFNNNGSINQNTSFNNITITSGTRNASGNITVLNNMIVNSIFNLNNNTLSISGSLSGTGTFNCGNQDISINGNVTISTISLPNNALANIGGVFMPGSFSHNNGTIVMNGSNSPVDLKSGNYYNITINKTNPTDIVRSSGLINIENNLTITQGILNLNGNNIDINGSVTISPSGELRCTGTEQINVGANWNNSGIFTLASSTVIFDTISTTTISGSTTFNNLSCTTAGKIINFTAGTTQTINGTLTITGASGNLITLQSTTAGTQWSIVDNGVETISFVIVSDGNATNSITALSSKNNGNNTNWIFSPTTLTWNGSTNTNWNVATNWDLGYVPNDSDNVVIADVANDPILTGNVTINDLTINANAILDTNGFDLTVSGTFSNNGRLRTNGSETLSLIMDVDSGEVEYKGGTGGNISFTEFYTLIINGTGNFTLSGNTIINRDVTISSGTLDGTNRTINIKGNWTNSVGAAGFTESNSTVIFDGTITPVNVSAETFNNVEINKTGTVNATGIWNVSGNITLTSGTFNPNNFTHNVAGNWLETGITFTPATGTINFNGASNITQRAGNNFFNVTISNNATLLSNMTMTGSLTINAGASLTMNNFNFIKTGAGAGIISGSISSNNGNFSYGGNITINATGSIVISGIGTLTISGTTTNSGTITAGTGNLTFTGNYTVSNNGILNGGTGSITFSGSYTSNNNGALNIGAVPDGNTAITFNGNASFNATSTFNCSPTTNPIIIVNRNLTFAATITYNQNNDTIHFQSGNATNLNSGGKTFHNIVINKGAAGTTVTLGANLTQAAGYTLTITQGTLNLNNFQFNLGADFSLSSANGRVTIGDGTFNGTGYNISQSNGIINQTNGTLNCNNFTKTGGTYNITGNGTINIANNFSQTGGTVSITASPTFNITNDFSQTGGSFTANSSNINIGNDFTLSGAYTFNANTSTISVSGNVSISGATFNCGTGTIVMTGAANKTLSSNQNLYNLTINSTATKTLSTNITQSAGGVLTITNGTLDLNGNTLTLGANFTQSAGTLIIGSGTFNGGSAYNVTINTGATVTQTTGTLNCNNFSVNGTATWTITGGPTLNIAGDTTIVSPNWNAGSSTINMTGAAKSINASSSLYHLNITGTVTINTNNLDINGNLTISGTFNANTQDISIAGNFEIIGAGVFNASTRKVTFDGAGDQIFRPRISSFYDIEINKTAGSVNLTGTDLTINRDFTITSGTFDTKTQNITITRNFIINGSSFIPNNQTVTFTGAVDSTFKTNNSSFWNIVINKNAANLRVTQNNNLLSSNNFTITQGIYDINGNNWTVNGTFSNNGILELNGNETTVSVTNDTDSGLVRYKGAGAGSLKVGNTYYNLEFNNGGGTWTLSSNIIVNNNLTITAGIVDAVSHQIDIGGTWTNTGTFSSNVDQIVRIFNYGASTPTLNTETNFKRLIIDASGKNVTIQGNITCNYFALYNGTLIFSGTRTLTVNGDFLALGNNGYINDTNTLDQWSGPVRIIDPSAPYSGAINLGATGSSIIVSNDFYVNGCNLLATANWNLNIPDNNDDVRKARAYGTITVQRSQANYWVAATDGPIDGGGNTNWDFNRPSITIAETRSDTVIYVNFNDTIENSNNEFNNAIASGFIRYNNDTDTFQGAYTDEACSTPLPIGDFTNCYLLISDTANRTWNTSATGVSSGIGTDRNGNVRNIIPNLTIRNNYILRDKAKNRILSLPFTYNGTIDRCKPVLISSEIDTETEAPNTFNIVRLEFSEPILAPGINTSYQNSDGTVNISAGGTGGGLTVAGNFSGFGSSTGSGTIITHSNTMNTVKATDANKRIFIIRLGGNISGGGCIYSNSPPTFTEISGNFQPNANLRDVNGNTIDTTVTRPINVTNNWELTPPTFSQIKTDERSGQINGFIDNLIIDFDRNVQVYDALTNFGNSSVIWGAITYTVDNVNHSQNSILNNFNLNLIENTTLPYGDTNSTPTITYINDSNFKFIANVGRVEMLSGDNMVAIDNCNPVITGVSFGIDDPSLSFKSAPYYDTITGNVIDPGAPPYNFNMHSGTGNTTLLPTQKTYHNYIMFKFSEPIASLNGVITDSSSDGYTFDNSQRSNPTFGDFTTASGNVTVEGFGQFQGNITVDSQSNFILFDDSQTCFIHVAGFYDTINSNFVGHITNSNVINVPNSSGTHYFTTIVNPNIIDNAGLSLRERDTGGANANKIEIDYIKDWDIIYPVFRYIPPTALYKGDPVSSEIPPTTLANGAATGSPLLNRVEFIMSKAIRDFNDGFDMNGAFVFTLEKGSLSIPASNLSYNTTVNKLGDLINSYTGTSLIDSDKDDQGFSITFDEEPGMTDDARIKWTYQQVAGKIITDLRGLRLQPVSTERYTLENKPPYIKETRAVVGSNKMYVEFNENVYHNPGMTDILVSDFTYTNVFSSGITITNITPIDKRRYILTLSQRIYQDHIAEDLIKANPNSIQDSLNNVIVNDIDNPVSYIGINFFEDVIMEDYVHKGEGWRITNFDGTERITIQNIRILAKINVQKFNGFRPILYYDVIDGEESKFWYPSKNKEARMVLGISKGNNIWEFNIPSNDSELKTGKELSFVFKIGTLYCYRAPRNVNDPKFSPYDAETYRIKIAELKEQNNKVSIYNNVINPNNNEETRLVYFLEKSGPVSIVVYDLSGNIVKVLVSNTESAGKHIISWNGVNENGKIVTRGVYFIRVRAPGIFNQIRKVLIVK